MLIDRLTGEKREVDVVITAKVAGQTLSIGIEARDHARPQGVEWVEQAKAKHERLPINQTVLVSRSGFTGTAHDLAKKYGIELVMPGEPISDGGPLAAHRSVLIEAREVSWSGKVRVLVWPNTPDGEGVCLPLGPTVALFAASGASLGTVEDYVDEVRDLLADETETALADPDSKRVHYTMEPASAEDPSCDGETTIHLWDGKAGTLFSAITKIEISLAMEIRVAPVPLTHATLQGEEFGSGTAQVNDNTGLIVMTDGEDDIRRSVRVTDVQGKSSDVDPATVRHHQLTAEQARRMQARAHTKNTQDTTAAAKSQASPNDASDEPSDDT